MAGKNRPGNRKGGNRPSNRGPHAPKPQPQPVRGKGTTHGKRAGSAGAGQTQPPSKPCKATLVAVPWTIIKLFFGWRPAGYQVADIPWPT